MADVQLRASGTATSPLDYPVPGAQEILLKGVRASFDGTGAGGSFVPTLQLVAPGGGFAIDCPIANTLAAGVSADVSWFPGVTPTKATAAGSGIQFGIDNVDSGGSPGLQVEAQQLVPADFTQPNAEHGAGQVLAFSQGFNASAGTLFTDSPGNFFNNANPVVVIVHRVTASHFGGEGLVIDVSDATAAPGDSSVIGADIGASSKSTVSPAEGLVVSATIEAAGTAQAIAAEALAVNNGTGDAIALQLTSSPSGGGQRIGIQAIGATGMLHFLKLPTAAGPAGSLWNNAGVVNVA